MIPHTIIRKIIKKNLPNQRISDDAIIEIERWTVTMISELAKIASMLAINSNRKSVSLQDVCIAEINLFARKRLEVT